VERVPRFDIVNVLGYFGALVAIAATSWLIAHGWAQFSHALLFFVSLGYTIVYSALALHLRGRHPIFAGLFAAMAASVVPLLVFSLEAWANWWPHGHQKTYEAFHTDISAGWTVMEIVTILFAVAAAAVVRYPFPLAVAAFAAWYMSMDLTPTFFGRHPSADDFAWTSLGAGIVLILIGVVLDLRGERRYAFWWHVFGLLAAAGALCWFTEDRYDATLWSIVTVVSFGALIASVPQRRTTWTVFGAWGLLAASCYWAHEAFRGSWGFPFVVSLIGVAFVGAAMLLADQRFSSRREPA
jgi:hypothetical protein